MAAPTAPTLADITTEALNLAGHANPSSALQARAQDIWMEEVKNDIYNIERKLKSLYTTSFAATVIGKSRYACPSDYADMLKVDILDGTFQGVCLGGASSSVTLSASETASADFVQGKNILMLSGTSAGSCSQATSYDDAVTHIANVSPNFTTTPVNGDGYMIVDSYYELAPSSIKDIDSIQTELKVRPRQFTITGAGASGEITIYPIPDKVYGLQFRYYSNLMTLDLAGTLMGNLYQRWRNVFVQGVFFRVLKSKDDSRMEKEEQKYVGLLNVLIANERDAFNLFQSEFIEPAFVK